MRRSKMTTATVCLYFAATLRGSVPGGAQAGSAPGNSAAAYDKSEYRIPMRDGIRLYTIVYTPRDTNTPYPILLFRTRYGACLYGRNDTPPPGGAAADFESRPYIIVLQDVRGSFLSEGAFVDMTPHIDAKRGATDSDQSSDTYDTIDWLLKNIPNNNGRVGLWGISYDGFFATAGMIDAHPGLVAVSPQAPQADWFGGDDVHLHGTFVLDAFEYLSAWGRPRRGLTSEAPRPFDFGTRDGYQFYLQAGPLENLNARYLKGASPMWNALMEHGTYDAYWKARNILPHLRDIKPAVMTVSGWYDANNLYGALHVYKTVEQANPSAYNILVIGPWFHGQWALPASDPRGSGGSLGDVSFGSATVQFYRESIEACFFDAQLKGRSLPNLPEAYIFETGANQWRTFDSWPPRNTSAQSLYFSENGGLSFHAPESRQGVDEYTSDPFKPVPFIERLATDRTDDYMIQDQRFAARRPDVLVYCSPPLTTNVTIAGPVRPSLWVSTTGTDADWVVKLIDVYADDAPEVAAATGTGLLRPGESMGGYEQLVRGESMRSKFRNSLERPEPVVPGERTKIEFTMLDVLHTFRKGHRIMVQVQSSWFPLLDRNPQTFTDIYHAKAADFHSAIHRVYRSFEAASSVEVHLLQ